MDVWACGVVYICLLFGGTMWAKAVKGDKGYDLYLASLDQFEHKKLLRESNAAKDTTHDESPRALEAEKSSASNTGPSLPSETDKDSLKFGTPETDGPRSRSSSILSMKFDNSIPVKANGAESQSRDMSLDNSIKTQDHPSSTSTKPTRIYKPGPIIKPDDIVQSPQPIAKAASAVDGPRHLSPHFLFFKSLDVPQRHLLYRLLDPHPETRIKAYEIKKDAYYKDIECCVLEPDELTRVQSGIFDASKMSGKPMPVKHKHPYHVIPKRKS